MGSSPSLQKRKGRKKKNGSVIPVLAHSRSCRTFKQRGNRAVPAGRKFKDPKVRKQMVINDQTDNVYYALPSSRDKARRQEHNLQKDISLNRSSAKKH